MYFPLFVFFVSAFAVFWLSFESHLKNTGDGSSYSSPQTYFVLSDGLSRLSVFWLPQLPNIIHPEAGLLNQSSHGHIDHLMNFSCFIRWCCFECSFWSVFSTLLTIFINRMMASQLKWSAAFSSWNHLIWDSCSWIAVLYVQEVWSCLLLILLPASYFAEVFLVPIQGLLFCVYIIAYCTERVNRLKVFFNHFYFFRQYDEKMFFYKNRLAADCRHFIQIKLQRISIIFLK
jgi:hypothetical protein